MTNGFVIISHTADIGVQARGKTRVEAYENAARGLFSLLAVQETVQARQKERVEVTGADASDLLVRWLHEILYLFDAKKLVFAEVQIEEFVEWRLTARLRGEPLDLARHETVEEIKAVTYHGARVEKEGEEWVAEVLFDI